MKRRVFLIGTVALLLGGAAISVFTQKKKQEPVLQQIEYSNFTDMDTQTLLTDLLHEADVSDTRIQIFMNHVQRFNQDMKADWLTAGFETAEPLDLKYDPYDMQDQWTEKENSFPGWNCRITSFGLFGDFVTFDGEMPSDAGADTLFMDYETLDEDPASLCGDSLQKFSAWFAPVDTANTTDIQTHLKNFQQEWNRSGLSFKGTSKLRLISVVFHDNFSETENTLMIGHTGILLPASDGLYFVEKVAFQEPYRLLKFRTRTELSDYLMLKYDTAWDQNTAHPFILENDALMDGWRILDDSPDTDEAD